jgi:hypothetical protein
MLFENVAKATLKIECGEERGSGFHFVNENTVATNYHVIKSCITNSQKVFAKTESGNQTELELLAYSPQEEYDYAILKTKENLGESRAVLEPKLAVPPRGIQVCFAGFPHGIDDLLVQAAHVSGPFGNLGFYIDGSVNGGNSGGPIVDMKDMKVVGIVTQRRFLTPINLDAISNTLNTVHSHFQRMGGRAGVVISGVDFGQFAQLMSHSFGCFRKILEANANTGIGIGYRIEFISQKFGQLE